MALRTLVSSGKTLGRFSRFQQQIRGLQTFTLPDLAYDYGALEPVISGEIMQLHHQKHHQTYITNYNKALEQLDDAIAKGDASTAVKLQSAIKFNGGGSILILFSIQLSYFQYRYFIFLSVVSVEPVQQLLTASCSKIGSCILIPNLIWISSSNSCYLQHT